ncbi:MAG: DUF805 domain-containing protein [Elusimicrobiaceae bacterium]|nr:DUF805 domain-containing protein [Elusimicrobiaceae bacterium]
MQAFNTYFVDVLKKHYIDFSGRATRTQFWMFVLFEIVVAILLGIVLSFIGDIGAVIAKICGLALLLPSLGIGARRLRDGGFSPWWLLLEFVPVVGNIVLLVMWLLPSKN